MFDLLCVNNDIYSLVCVTRKYLQIVRRKYTRVTIQPYQAHHFGKYLSNFQYVDSEIE